MSIRGQTKKHRWLLQEELLGIEDLEVSHVLPQELLDRKTKIQTELLKILEELYWHKRSKLKLAAERRC